MIITDPKAILSVNTGAPVKCPSSRRMTLCLSEGLSFVQATLGVEVTATRDGNRIFVPWSNIAFLHLAPEVQGATLTGVFAAEEAALPMVLDKTAAKPRVAGRFTKSK